MPSSAPQAYCDRGCWTGGSRRWTLPNRTPIGRTTRVNKCHAHLKTFPSHIFSYWCWFSLACTFQMWIPLIPSVNLKIFIVQIWLISLPPNLRNSHFLHWFSAKGLFKGKLRTKSILRNNFTFYFQISQSTCFLDRKTWMISKSLA